MNHRNVLPGKQHVGRLAVPGKILSMGVSPRSIHEDHENDRNNYHQGKLRLFMLPAGFMCR
jgi:hypothetical protein